MTTTGICHVPAVALRAEPSERSEMVSQLLFGETVKILRYQDRWLQIFSDVDQYVGWVFDNTIMIGTFESCLTKQVATAPLVICQITGNPIYLPGGSFLPPVDQIEKYDEIFPVSTNREEDFDIVTLAKQYLGAPYLWGGKTIFGIDCSGLVQIIFRMCKKWLPRDASQQARMGEEVSENIFSGDLAFFKNDVGNIVHVGILCDANSIIHASGNVHIDLFDKQGIFEQELGKYTHQLAFIKRI